MEQSALQAAKEADLVVMPMGEHYLQSGEATSRAMIDVPENPDGAVPQSAGRQPECGCRSV